MVRGQFRRTVVRLNGGQRIRPGLFGAQADTARHPSGLPRVPIGKKEFARLRWVSRSTLNGRCSYQLAWCSIPWARSTLIAEDLAHYENVTY